MRGKALRYFGVLLPLCILLIAPQTTFAATDKTRGLQISPLKQYMTVSASSQKIGNFTVANLTDKPMTVDFSIKRFSVSDYAYNFKFSKPLKNWLSISIPSIELMPGDSKAIPFTLTIPSNGASGGYYYTFIASSSVINAGVISTVQATSLLYLTVDGNLITSSKILDDSITRISYGRDIDYSFNLQNTGNVHYFVYPSGRLAGLFTGKDTIGAAHVLLPGTKRTVGGSINSPLFPGIYRAEYGYTAANGTAYVQHRFIAYVPLWSIAGLLVIIFAVYKLRPVIRGRGRRH